MKPFTIADYIAELQKLPQDTVCLMEDSQTGEFYGTAKVRLRTVKAREISQETSDDGNKYATYEWLEPTADTQDFLIL